MPFLTLNGITVPVVEGRRRQVNIGQDSRAFSGAYRLGRRAVRREWDFRTGPLSLDEAEAFRGLIAGDGHTLSFDTDAFTSRGLGATSTVPTNVGGKFGTAANLAGGGIAFWDVFPGPRWTVFHFRFDSSGAGWEHFLFRDDGQRWFQGVGPSTKDGGSQLLDGETLVLIGSGTATSFDDAVVLPFRVPASWVGQLYDWHSSRPWSALPYLTAGGTFAPSEVQVIGEVKESEFVEFVNAGARIVGERFEFTLREV